MGLTVAEYDATPGLIVDWDLQFYKVEQDIERDAARKAHQQGGG